MSKSNFLNLLNSVDEFVVPTIQRDYAQGRNEGSNKKLCEEVRTGLIDSLYTALINDKELLLDYIYGTDISGIFYPIDGQQRLTTLFLLHWYIGKKERINTLREKEFDVLRKFSYEIRDTSKEFCGSLIDIDIDFEESTIKNQIKDSSRYHNTYNYDPTVLSMLVVLDSIHNKFKDTEENLWDRLSKIQFWCLSLEKFGLTDDLFVKMNARGKRLTRFDVFKSDLESKIEKMAKNDSALEPLVEEWKKEIDNTYLDAFWKKFGFELSERNLFRTILFFVKTLISAKNTGVKYDDSWETDESNVNYYDVLAEIENNTETLSKICMLLSNFEAWKSHVGNLGLFIINKDAEAENTTGYNKVMLFGILYWFANDYKLTADSTFDEFNRILKNYVLSLRQYNIKPRNYSSSIDNSNVGRCFEFVKKLLDGYTKTTSFYDYVKTSAFPEIDYEREKLNHSNLSEITDIEAIKYVNGNTHNIFFDGNVWLQASHIIQIFDDDNMANKAIRVIYSYADDEYGKFQKLLIDEITQQSGKKQLYYIDEDDKATAYFHKMIFNRSAEFGDNILTARGSNQYAEISKCVRLFAKDLSKKINSGTSVSNAIDELLNDRLSLSSFADSQNIKWYIVKYSEFFYDKFATSLSVLRRKNYGGIDDENIYDIQCLSSSDNDFYREHYHPFYLALSHMLNNRITIDEATLKYKGVQIEYAHPCILSNGWRVQIDRYGDWIIDFRGNIPSSAIQELIIDSSGTGKIDCVRQDSIEHMATFLNSL